MNIEAIDFLNQLNEYGKIDYEDYSHLHDLLTSDEPGRGRVVTDLEEYAVALDMFPALTPEDRAIIFAAIEEAPEERPDSWDMNEHYFDSPAYRTWKDAAQVPLSYSGTRWAVDLAEASGFASIVTREDILAALHRGKMLVDG